MVPGLCHCNGFSLVVANGDYSLVGGEASHCGGFSCCGAQALGHAGSVVVGLSHSIAYGIFPTPSHLPPYPPALGCHRAPGWAPCGNGYISMLLSGSDASWQALHQVRHTAGRRFTCEWPHQAPRWAFGVPQCNRLLDTLRAGCGNRIPQTCCCSWVLIVSWT